MSDCKQDELNGLRLPEELGLRRREIAEPEDQGTGYREKYDYLTLFYDAVWLPGQRRAVLFCPKLLNFEDFIREAGFTQNGKPLALIGIRRRRRYDEVVLGETDGPGAVTLTWRSWHTRFNLSVQDHGTFRGLNCVIAISQNNELSWIREWLGYHIREQGLQAVLLFDNESSAYDLAALRECVHSVRGLQAASVVSAPYSYGPKGVNRRRAMSKFLQSALLNIARLRYFGEAGAVLSIDIDEIVISDTSSETIFEAARRSWTGYVPIRGRWLFEAPGDTAPHYRDHCFTSATKVKSPYKYCVRPHGPFGDLPREVHGIGGNLPNRLLASHSHAYWHFWNINTGWKEHRRQVPADIAPDESLRLRLRSLFPARSEED